MQGVRSCKSFRKALEVLQAQQTKQGNQEYALFIEGLRNLYDKYHPRREVSMETKAWKGKSALNIIKGVDKLTIIKFKRPDKNSIPEEIKVEVSQEEINAIIESIKFLSKKGVIDTKELAMLYSNKLNLGYSGWKTGSKPFFSDRSHHYKFTMILGALADEGFIEYKRGKTKLLEPELSIKNVLLLS